MHETYYNHLKPLVRGFVMGLAEAVPGVSGSTFALIMGIYTDFIDLLHSLSDTAKAFIQLALGRIKIDDFIKKMQEIDFPFAVALLSGMLLAIGTMSHAVSEVIDRYPQYLSAFFFGLVLSSVIIPFKSVKTRTTGTYLLIIITAVVTFILLGFRVTSIDDPSYLLLFIGGIVGVSGLILPGISGSFILLMLGIYEYILNAVKLLTKLDFSVNTTLPVLIFMMGLVFGFIFFVRLVKYAFAKYPSQLLSIIVGLMIGSLRVIYPFYDISQASGTDAVATTFNSPMYVSDGYSLLLNYTFILLGVLIVVGMQYISSEKEKPTE